MIISSVLILLEKYPNISFRVLPTWVMYNNKHCRRVPRTRSPYMDPLHDNINASQLNKSRRTETYRTVENRSQALYLL
jgi:hypothetical protein